MATTDRPAPANAPSPLRNPEFARLLPISITVALGFGMIIPVLPNYARSFGVSLAAIGLIQLVFGLTRFSSNLVGGLIVDRFGERASTVTGLLIVSASSFAMGLSGSFPQLIVARGFGGIGSALFISGLMTRILRIIEPAAMGRATGQFRSSFLVGIAVGPFIGGILYRLFGAAAPFHVYGAGLVVAAVIAWYVMRRRVSPEKSPERRPPLEALRVAVPLLKDRRYVIALAATFVGWWALSGPTQTIGPIFAQEELGLTADIVGIAVTMLAVGEIAVLLFSGRAADRFGRKAVMIPSLGVAAIAVSAIGLAEATPWIFFATMVAAGGGIAASSTAAGGLLADSIPKGGSGAAVGVNQMAGDLGYLLAPTVVGWVAQSWGYGLAFVVGAIPAAIVCVWSLALANERPTRDEETSPVQEPVG